VIESPSALAAALPDAKPSVQAIHTVDGYTLLQKHFAPIPFIFDDLLYSGLTLCAGRPKVGKSWFALQLAIDAALGRAGFARFANRTTRKVLYLGLEESERRTHTRLAKFISRGAEDAILSGNIQFAYKLLPLLGGGIEELDATIEKHQAQFVVVDTLIRAMGGRARDRNADATTEDYKVVEKLQALAAKHDAAILTIAHTRKLGADYALDKVAGTTGVTAGADAIWVLDRGPQSTMLSIQGREMGDAEYTVRFDEDPERFGWSITGTGEDAKTSQSRSDILDLLEESQTPMTPKDIAKSLRKNAVTIRRLLGELRKDGRVAKTAEGYRLT
jgi:hypothetical protein